jgi:hypothetical protein
MSRSGYIEDFEDQWGLIRWRGAVKSAIRGQRGQVFLKEMLTALDSLPEKKLISGFVKTEQGEVCALGSVLAKRNADTSKIEQAFKEDFDEDYIDEEWLTDELSGLLNISGALVREIEYINDEEAPSNDYERFNYVRNWVVKRIKDPIFGV